ncbi:MAG TPA: FAD-dependent monooxygenase, partial [Vineibacter sp.]|nr:FAD-dependent monooxygenase [Vineibacter sp.]
RGEYLVPWGVAELQRLGLLDVLLRAGAHWTRRQIPYGDSVAPDAARRLARDLGQAVPDVSGALCLGHPAICDAFLEAAIEAGAKVLRGARVTELVPGDPPTIGVEYQGQVRVFRPHLVVGADGRGSPTAKRLGFRIESDAPHHLLGGLLVQGAEDWPQDDQTIGIFGDRVLYIFPQGSGKARLYAATGYDARRAWSGGGAVERFLDAFRHGALPNGDAIAAAHQAGPLQAYPNHDCWIEQPSLPGVVLIGDAAGHNDPSLGQGLALALRDVRIVVDLLLANRGDTPIDVAGYVGERSERLSRLRFAGRVLARTRYEFDDRARRRTDRLFAACAADPSLGALLGIFLKGPEHAPAETFAPSRWERLLSAE